MEITVVKGEKPISYLDCKLDNDTDIAQHFADANVGIDIFNNTILLTHIKEAI